MAKNSLQLPAHGTLKQKLRHLFVQRNHKDLLFIRLFQDKRELLQLYNALNGTHYENEQDLTIATIDDVIYMGPKNARNGRICGSQSHSARLALAWSLPQPYTTLTTDIIKKS